MKKRRRGRGEGAVFFSESKGCWVGRAVVGEKPNGGPKYKEVTARSKGELLDRMRRAEADAREGVGGGSRSSVADYFRHWLDDVAKRSVEATTWEVYERTVRVHIEPRLGDVAMGQVTPRRVEAFFAALHADGVTGGLARKVSQVLSACMRHAARVGVIKAAPTALVVKPKVAEREIEPFTADEARAILATAAAYRYSALFALAFATGARQGELLGLGREHVDLGKATIRIERSLCRAGGKLLMKSPKTKRGRRAVELPPFATAALRAHLARVDAEGNGAAPVVFCTGAGAYLDRNQLRHQWDTVLIKAGVRHRKFHNTRHTHVTQLLSKGVSLVEVARRIGDHPETVLRVYSHYLPCDSQVPALLESLYG